MEAVDFLEGRFLIHLSGQRVDRLEQRAPIRDSLVVQPAGQQSIIGLWVEPPVYSNTLGTLKLVGTIPGGMNTKSGLVAKITFKALASGDTRITISSQSQILANDGLGTPVVASFGDALYTVTLQPPEGPNVFSETHQFPDHWYNNNTPVMDWDKNPGVIDYSYVVDDQPFTIPGNIANTTDNRISLPNLSNGISYFHIKARKGSVWGGTTHFALHIDTLPPAAFTPTYEKLTSGGTLVSFFTTDSLSGIDHYEIGVIDMKESLNMTPLFEQVQSPFQLPAKTSSDMRVIVRAIDVAGNVRDGQVAIAGFSFLGFMQDNIAIFISILLFIITVLVIVTHYLFVRRVSRALSMAVSERQGTLGMSHPQYYELPPARPAQYQEKKPTTLDVLHTQSDSTKERVYSPAQDIPKYSKGRWPSQ